MQINDILLKYNDYIKKTNNVYTVKNDTLEYNLVELENKLKIFFIQDTEATNSSAHMFVDVGSNRDYYTINNKTFKILGLAHFLEHMLFMGSDLYPGGSFFQKTLEENGGETNAYTSSDSTNYYFSVRAGKFSKLLEIFSRFFVKPLFETKYVKKEVSAVDSEHKKNISSDMWRHNDIFRKFILNPEFNKFSTGDKSTLVIVTDEDVNELRKRLLEFYELFYSSDNMVVFISHNKIDTAFIDYVKTIFKHVPLRNHQISPIPSLGRASYREFKDSYEMIYVKSIKKENSIDLNWFVESNGRYVNNIRIDSFDIMANILGHEGHKSLYSLLMNDGYINNLSVGMRNQYNENSAFNIHINLTEKGYIHRDDIIYIVCQYIDNLSNSNVIETFYDEDRKNTLISTIDYIGRDGMAIAEMLSYIYDTTKMDLKYGLIRHLALDNIEIIGDHFTKTLKSLTLNRLKIIVSSYLKIPVKKAEKYYGTKYSINVVPIDNNKILKYAKINGKNYIPDRNVYLPDSLVVINPLSKSDNNYDNYDKHIKYIKLQDEGQCYVKSKNNFKTYKSIIDLSFELDHLNRSKKDNIISYLLIMLYSAYIYDIKNPDIYSMGMGNYVFGQSIYHNTYQINISGYPDKIIEIFEIILKWMLVDDDSVKIDEKIYERLYTRYYNIIHNSRYQEPFRKILDLHKILNPNVITDDDKMEFIDMFNLEAMKSNESEINFNNFRKKAIVVISTAVKGSMKGMFGGSIKIEDCKKIIKLLESYLTFVDRRDHRENLIDFERNTKEQKIINIKSMNPHEVNTAVLYCIFLSKSCQSNKNNDWIIPNCYNSLIRMFVNESFVSHMRTENEMGYIVFSTLLNVNYSTELEKNYFLGFIIQRDNRETHLDINQIIKSYIDEIMYPNFLKLSDDKFESMRQGVLNVVSEKYHNVFEELDYSFSTILSKKYVDSDIESFDKQEKMIKALKSITKNGMIEYFKKIYQNNYRVCISITPNDD